MKNKQTKGLDTIAWILAFVGLGAVAIIAMLAVAPPEWDAASQELADTWFCPGRMVMCGIVTNRGGGFVDSRATPI